MACQASPKTQQPTDDTNRSSVPPSEQAVILIGLEARMTSAQVRGKLVEALQLDLVGPGPGLGNPAEILP